MSGAIIHAVRTSLGGQLRALAHLILIVSVDSLEEKLKPATDSELMGAGSELRLLSTLHHDACIQRLPKSEVKF